MEIIVYGALHVSTDNVFLEKITGIETGFVIFGDNLNINTKKNFLSDNSNCIDGYVTNKNRFVTDEEAMVLAMDYWKIW